MSQRRSGFSRRDVFIGLGVAGGALAARPAVARAASGAQVPPAEAARDAHGAAAPETAVHDPAVREFFGSITAGTRVGRWIVVDVRGREMGAIAVVLAAASGERFQCDVLRRDDGAGAPLGVGNTASLSVFLRNGGDGATATAEEQGLGAMALADALARREAEGAVPPADLLTLRQRLARFPSGAFATRG